MPINPPADPERVYYFDSNATTCVAPEVRDAMLPFLTELWANPSSPYQFGQRVAQHLRLAREKVAALINADPREIIFTSCGTESNNTALRSALRAEPQKRHIVTAAVEHSATINFCETLAEQGFTVTYLPVDSDGALDLNVVEQSIQPETAIVSVMTANNETGVLFPVDQIAALCRSRGVLFHTDAVQAAGKLRVDVKASGVDLLSLSAHKLHAPKGVGLLYVRRGVRFQPYIVGGQQEGGRRGGTENMAGIVGFGRAAELSLSRLDEQHTGVRAQRDRLETEIIARIPKAIRNGAPEPRLPNTSNLSFEGLEAEALLIQLDRLGICASSGSACTSGSLEPSHVLRAMGLSVARARASIRLSLSRYTTAEEVDYLLEQLPIVLRRLRALS